MKAYASRTGTRRNLAALRAVGWGLLVSATGVWRTEGFDDWVAENGQWTERNNPGPFNAERYERFLAWCAAEPIGPQWLALPDIVFGGLGSLGLSQLWLDKLRQRDRWRDQLLMIVVQDGMEPRHLRSLIGPTVGVFVGGSTDWKLATMRSWADAAHDAGGICHVGRVNTARRINLCAAASVDSFDGSSPSRFAVTTRPLELARQQTDLEQHLGRRAA